MNIKITQTGFRACDRIIFEVDRQINFEEAMEIQTQKGYSPAGYGFEDFKQEVGKTTWTCWTSCD
jgi:hypothetical protein